MRIAGLLFSLFLSLVCHAQDYSNWVFGFGAGLSFNGGNSPSFFRAGNFSAPEGSASISDEKGRLLFYTDGQIIYNREHEPIPNGTGLMGHASAYQSAVIVRQPNNDSLFFVFTNDAVEHSYQNGYRYSVVNMARDGGLGAVTEKNVALLPTTSERMTAARHANGIDVWVIGNPAYSDKFYAWLVTCKGVQSPVVSTAGEMLAAHERMTMGAMKVSPDGKLLCQTHFPDGVLPGRNFAQLFDFDNSAGTVSNARKIGLTAMNSYDCEFSPNSEFLYFTDPMTPHIGQVEAKRGTAAEILASFVPVPSAQGYYGIQAAVDARIYLTNSSSALGAINQPDAKGTLCQYERDRVPLAANAKLNLPSVVREPRPDPNGFFYKIIDSCQGLVQFEGYASNAAQTLWEWNFGDGSTSTEQKPIHRFADLKKRYPVSLKIRPPAVCGFLVRTKQIAPGGVFAKAGFTYDVKCDSGFVQFRNASISSGAVTYLWEFGDGSTDTAENPVHTYTAAGAFQVRLSITLSPACLAGSETKVVETNRPDVKATASRTEIIETETVQLSATGRFNSIEWSPAETVQWPLAQKTPALPYRDVTYYARVRNAAGCANIDSVSVRVTPLKDFYVPSAFTPNGDGRNETFAPLLGHSFGIRNFAVFNRWGQKVFETRTKGHGWDGRCLQKTQPASTYAWVLEATTPDGRLLQKKGTVLLLR